MAMNFATFFNQMAARVKEAPQQQGPDYLKLIKYMSDAQKNNTPARDYMAELLVKEKGAMARTQANIAQRLETNAINAANDAAVKVKLNGGTDEEARRAYNIAYISVKGGKVVLPKTDVDVLRETLNKETKKTIIPEFDPTGIIAQGPAGFAFNPFGLMNIAGGLSFKGGEKKRYTEEQKKKLIDAAIKKQIKEGSYIEGGGRSASYDPYLEIPTEE